MGLPSALQFIAAATQDPGQPQDNSFTVRDHKQGGTGQAPPTATTEQPPPQGQPQGQPPQGPGGLGCGTEQLLMMLGMLAIFYFLLIRPSQKQEKKRKEMLGRIKRGDRVVTSGGLHGVVAGIADDTIQIRVDGEGKVKLTFDRGAIARVVEGEAKAEDPPAKP